MIDIKFNVNGKDVKLTVDDSLRLLDILRDELGLTGTKEGCAVGECGACTVIMNGEAVNSCMILAEQVQNAKVETVENLEKNEVLSKLQDSFLDNGAIQCGFCTPGMLMSAKALLDKSPTPSEEEIKTALEGNLCRCTGYIPILNSVKDAIEKINLEKAYI
ncbi:MAG: (2Fe-2S)-binding protein [Candidatus Cloacimonetes bacterium]|nr:(2Fe-2S)-binding protein [Candidatus Cloacimonadota bacterium]MBL7149859.1 (2Fe-2S)-binding protein [Candidatus Cloacimonadota bacterium]